MNLLGPEMVRDLVTLIRGAEADVALKVLVFKSADPDYFISHVDVTRIKEYRDQAAKLVGELSIGLLFRRLSTSRLVSVAQIEGRVRAAGSEFVLACDMRFAARETAIFSQPEPAFGQVPGAGGVQHLVRLMGAELVLVRGINIAQFEQSVRAKLGEFTSPTADQEARKAGLAQARHLVEQVLTQVRAQAELKKSLAVENEKAPEVRSLPSTHPVAKLLN